MVYKIFAHIHIITCFNKNAMVNPVLPDLVLPVLALIFQALVYGFRYRTRSADKISQYD